MDDEWSDDLPWIGQYILDENGEPVPAKSLREWGRWMETSWGQSCRAGNKIGNALVSTVFLGLDHDHGFVTDVAGFDPAPYKPVLWETMIFGGAQDLFQVRYTSRADALAGHGKIVQMLTS